MNRRKRMLNDLDQDIRDHIEVETQDNIARGMSPEEARYAALRKFGNVTRVKEETREVWSFVWLEQLLQDIRLGFRMLLQVPGLHGCRHPHPRSRHRRKHSDIQCDQWSAAQSASLQESAATRRHKGKRFAPERDGYPETDARILTGWRNQRRADGLHRRNRTCASPCRAHQCGVSRNARRAADAGPDHFARGRCARRAASRHGKQPFLAKLPWQRSTCGGHTIQLGGNPYTVIGVMPASFAPPAEHADVFVSLMGPRPGSGLLSAICTSCIPTGD